MCLIPKPTCALSVQAVWNMFTIQIFLYFRIIFFGQSLSNRITECKDLVVLRVSLHISNCFLKALHKCLLPQSYIFSRDGSVLDLTAEGEDMITYCCQLLSLGIMILMFLVDSGLLGQASGVTFPRTCSELAACIWSHSWRPGTFFCGLCNLRLHQLFRGGHQ